MLRIRRSAPALILVLALALVAAGCERSGPSPTESEVRDLLFEDETEFYLGDVKVFELVDFELVSTHERDDGSYLIRVRKEVAITEEGVELLRDPGAFGERAFSSDTPLDSLEMVFTLWGFALRQAGQVEPGSTMEHKDELELVRTDQGEWRIW
ncbi:hypothetical protein [Halorhodospira halophila]|uniref:Lipoprotein n=1 Tax=Halorhodospira halophila (strain DSM 244 / SL1) TaxID=349124 RepID=A1WZ33_HALHL|nr:hypothetical protein [Halorhodospira halophila]ABM62945.1 hypothetical protein Hhal_2181 [Halorhodospira halophila SL1]MBK1727934.1 hypothetical protein [Halorhodospira halophila]